MKIPLLLVALVLVPAAHAAEDGAAAIAALGNLNGIALACQQPAVASRARNAMTTTAPKTRDNGERFENATNAAFLEQGKGAACPDAAALAARLAEAEKRLQAAFPTR
jgi:hypothetical protein